MAELGFVQQPVKETGPREIKHVNQPEVCQVPVRGGTAAWGNWLFRYKQNYTPLHKHTAYRGGPAAF